jgi:hypothetical protein
MEGRRPQKTFLVGNFIIQDQLENQEKWEDVVWRKTSLILGMRGRRRRADEREEWRRLLREIRVQKGL